jgi:NAD(P)-dependent dehydrogenase (short-subunit alcohol dehydrogenase family)
MTGYVSSAAFLGQMIERGKGVIVNVSSVEGVRAYPNDPVYASAKAAVNHFTASMALAYGQRGIRVVGIAPDITNTAQVPYDETVQADPRWKWWAPIGRYGTPEDNADVVVALASEQFRFVTGAVVNTDGGTVVGGGWFWNGERRFVNRLRASTAKGGANDHSSHVPARRRRPLGGLLRTASRW